MKRKNGFSLVEVLGVILVISILTAMVVPWFGKTADGINDKMAVERAILLKGAMTSYLVDVGPGAHTTWSTLDQEQRYAKVRSYLDSAPATLAAFQPNGYEYQINALNEPVGVRRIADGVILQQPFTVN